jgi:hypothetical protein
MFVATVTLAEPFTPLEDAVAVIVALPTDTPVTAPVEGLTVAIPGASLLQMRVLSTALSGATVVVSVVDVSPTIIVSVAGATVTEATCTTGSVSFPHEARTKANAAIVSVLAKILKNLFICLKFKNTFI